MPGRLRTAVRFPERWVSFKEKQETFFFPIGSTQPEHESPNLRKFLYLEQSSSYFMMKFKNTQKKKLAVFIFPNFPNSPGAHVIGT